MADLTLSPILARMEDLDETDIQILADLGSPTSPQWNVRTSYAELAKRLGLDEETVRLRVKRVRERGYMPAWRIRINPNLIGCRAAGLDLTVPKGVAKAEVIARLRLIPGVVLLADFRDDGLILLFWYADEPSFDRTRRLIESICGGPARALWRSAFAEPTGKLRRIDWQILDLMKDDARKDLRAVASALRVSVRTVQRRLKSMVAGRAIMLEGTPDVSRMGGLICDYLVHSPDRGAKRAADALVPFTISRIGATDTSPDHYSVIGVSCQNFAQAELVHSKLKELYGTDEVRLGVVREFIPVNDWLDEQLRSRATGPRSMGGSRAFKPGSGREPRELRRAVPFGFQVKRRTRP